MYLPVGWPRLVDLSIPSNGKIHKICCDRVKIIFAAITDNVLGLWYAKPLTPLTYHLRSSESIDEIGSNKGFTWKPDSSRIAVFTNKGYIIIYSVDSITDQDGIFKQIDPPILNLKRDSAELLMQETIPAFALKQLFVINIEVQITSVICINLSELMIATENSKLIKIDWSGEYDQRALVEIQNIGFTFNQQKSFNNSSPRIKTKAYIKQMDYSPLIGGFAICFDDGRAGFLTSPNLKFAPNQVQGLWAPNIEDATCCGINHKFRLLAFGRKNSAVSVFCIDDNTGGLELCHKLHLSPKDYSGNPGPVNELKWTPDGCAVIISWEKGGFSLWSTFGTMLMCSLVWDYGLHINLAKENPFPIYNMEWLAEGYQLLMLKNNFQNSSSSSSQINSSNPTALPNNHNLPTSSNQTPTQIGTVSTFAKYNQKRMSSVMIIDFVKSTLTINPGMSSNSHIILQGEDKLYVSQGKNLDEIYFGTTHRFPNNTNNHQFQNDATFDLGGGTSGSNVDDDSSEISKSCNSSSILSENKLWAVVQLPLTYSSCNCPIRYTAIDQDGNHIAIAGRTGFAHYSLITKRWKVFGNQTQEKDFIVTAGLIWWFNYIIMGCYSLLEDTYEIRIYPKDTKLDNRFGTKVQVKAPVIILSLFKNQLVVFTADGFVNTFKLSERNAANYQIDIESYYEIDVRNVCIHPACVVSLTISNLKNDMAMKSAFEDIHEDTIVLNVSGRLLLIQRNSSSQMIIPSMSTCIASSVECFWLSSSEKGHMRDCLWLYSGIHGMRVWLPVLPSENELKKPNRHTFMSKRIMLSFPLKLYPLVIFFDDAIVLGVENDTILYSSDNNSHFSLPFSIINKKSQVYLHKILRQLIKRNLGYTAWEIATSCSKLPYFPHCLELLLHEVLEEEATSKDPIPDPLLPSILEFIKEFPVHLQTIVQCARKTEIALWPYLFATAGKPKELFLQSLSLNQLDIAANYLIILQNLEPSSISRQYATLLFDTALENKKWELAKDLSRFLKAIDPCEVDSPRTTSMSTKISSHHISNHHNHHQHSSQQATNTEELNFILGSTVARGRSFSTATMISKPREFLFRSTSQSDDKQPLQQHQQQQQSQLNQSQNHHESTLTPETIRKKSTPSKKDSLDKSSILNETFFFEVIIQRHARKLLETHKICDLGYMSAILDFPLVGWLSQESNRSAKVSDFVSVLNQLHHDLNWPKPIGDEFDTSLLNLNIIQQQQQQHHLKSVPSDSGYFSFTTSQNDKNNFETLATNSSSLNTIQSSNNLPEISEESIIKDAFDYNSIASNQSCDSNIINGGNGEVYSIEAITNNGITIPSTTSTIAGATISKRNSTEYNNEIINSNNSYNKKRNKTTPPNTKLEVQLRYLLQLFTEANCIDFSLILSILLLDGASIERIINFVIRSESLSSCQQIRNGLEQIIKWSLNEQNGYKYFMISLQPQLMILDEYILKQKLFHEQYFGRKDGGNTVNNNSGILLNTFNKIRRSEGQQRIEEDSKKLLLNRNRSVSESNKNSIQLLHHNLSQNKNDSKIQLSNDNSFKLSNNNDYNSNNNNNNLVNNIRKYSRENNDNFVVNKMTKINEINTAVNENEIKKLNSKMINMNMGGITGGGEKQSRLIVNCQMENNDRYINEKMNGNVINNEDEGDYNSGDENHSIASIDNTDQQVSDRFCVLM